MIEPSKNASISEVDNRGSKRQGFLLQNNSEDKDSGMQSSSYPVKVQNSAGGKYTLSFRKSHASKERCESQKKMS